MGIDDLPYFTRTDLLFKAKQPNKLKSIKLIVRGISLCRSKDSFAFVV